MNINELDYYPRFIFTSNDGTCLSTTDKKVLDEMLNAKTNESKKGYTVGDEIYLRTQPERKFKVIDIRLRKIYDKSETIEFGLDSSYCESSIGVEKKPLFLIYITIEKI